jgi:predicted hotdog family 3-hydroxylacyl-ACP dehydratase
MTGTDRALIAQLIPHQGSMSLLDRIASWDESSIVATASTHRSTAHHLRDNGRLRAVHLCEYGAQAAALHGGLVARAAGGRAAPGYLVSLRGISFACQHVDDLAGDLQIRAELLLLDTDSWQYSFSASHAGTVLASGRLAIIRRK